MNLAKIKAVAAVVSYVAIVSLAAYNLRGELFGMAVASAHADSAPVAPAQAAPEPAAPTPGGTSELKSPPEAPPQPSSQKEKSPKENSTTAVNQASLQAQTSKETRVQRSSIPVAGNGSVNVGERLPDFLLTGLNGNTLNESALRGHKTLFIIVSPICPHCQKELKLLHEIENDYPSIVPIFASVFNLEQTKPLADMTGEGDHIYTGAMDLAKGLGVGGVPFVMLIDEKGVVRAIKKGELDESTFRDLLGKFAHGQPVAELPNAALPDAALSILTKLPGEQA
jgi:thiol-disulfide isomerase/thioredoxin